MEEDVAEKYNIKTYSDLVKYSDEFVFSPTLAFENRKRRSSWTYKSI